MGIMVRQKGININSSTVRHIIIESRRFVFLTRKLRENIGFLIFQNKNSTY